MTAYNLSNENGKFRMKI